MGIRRGTFDAGELRKCRRKNLVVHATGGPLMRVRCVEGDSALCEWDEWEEVRDGGELSFNLVKRNRLLLPVATLRSLVPFVPGDDLTGAAQ